MPPSSGCPRAKCSAAVRKELCDGLDSPAVQLGTQASSSSSCFFLRSITIEQDLVRVRIRAWLQVGNAVGLTTKTVLQLEEWPFTPHGLR